MNYLIEGVDGSFKSTIAKKLSDKFHLPIVRGSSFKLATGTNEELYKFSLGLTQLNNTIIERGIYSNRVYATLYPEYTILTHEQRQKIENKMKSNTIVIYLTASPDVIIDRLEKRGDEYITTDRVEDIIGMYNAVMSDAVHNGIKVYTYDTGILSSDDIVAQISEILLANGQAPDIKCEKCGKITSRKNAYFNKTHCFNCYLKIMKELLETENEKR